MSHTMVKWVLRAKSIKSYTCTNRRVKNININFKNLTPVLQPPNITLIASQFQDTFPKIFLISSKWTMKLVYLKIQV